MLSPLPKVLDRRQCYFCVTNHHFFSGGIVTLVLFLTNIRQEDGLTISCQSISERRKCYPCSPTNFTQNGKVILVLPLNIKKEDVFPTSILPSDTPHVTKCYPKLSIHTSIIKIATVVSSISKLQKVCSQ